MCGDADGSIVRGAGLDSLADDAAASGIGADWPTVRLGESRVVCCNKCNRPRAGTSGEADEYEQQADRERESGAVGRVGRLLFCSRT